MTRQILAADGTLGRASFTRMRVQHQLKNTHRKIARNLEEEEEKPTNQPTDWGPYLNMPDQLTGESLDKIREFINRTLPKAKVCSRAARLSLRLCLCVPSFSSWP